mmetsp:Transcript_6110/g.7027  ORF Transcript_6110/g.7027 Transcript_6110/m.7027 type:complete len:446 (+) Transcript_6110:281-1618(+)|eukprot:CAMPEP_0184019502 /NCGR_PEP_ID=MMETSP0954-20121128/8789_1 /TAXON_ID=627963 /ORGANISM="Aplanochytrium sp, Strain PBS07" /LENGTH=445 /DNA_ID=CAMNT_0026301179 /DNA_START=215 /DNA_END=1552 /DNA_ORIENTATION=+
MGNSSPKIDRPTLVVVALGPSGRKIDLDSVFDLPIDVVLMGFKNAKLSRTWKSRKAGWIEIPYVPDEFHHTIPEYKDYFLKAALASLKSWSEKKGKNVDGVVCYDDQGLELVAYLCNKLNLPGTPPEIVECFQDKYTFRMRCAQRGLPSIVCKHIDSMADIDDVLRDPDWPYPCILKPRQGAGSSSVRKVETPEVLKREYSCVVDELNNSGAPDLVKMAGFVLEEYFDGEEVDIDGWVTNGKLTLQVVSDNNPALEPYFLEMGGTYPSQLPRPAIEKLEQVTEQFFQAFPGVHSPFVLEAKINTKTLKVMLIEMNGRCSGAEAAYSFESVTGHNLPKIAAYLALGKHYPFDKRDDRKVICSANLYGNPNSLKKQLNGRKHRNNYIFERDEHENGEVGTMYFNESGVIKNEEDRNRYFIGWIASGSDTFDDAMDKLVAKKKQLGLL